MKRIRGQNLVVILIVTLFANGLASVVAAQVARQAQETKRVKTPRERIAERNLPNITLTTHEGRKVKFYDDLIKDKIVILNFMYAKCEGICPGTTANLVKLQRVLGDRVGKDIFMYSITLDPERDTPAVLNRYAKAYHTKPGWLFLTGNPKDVELLRRSLGFIDLDPLRDANKSNHIGMLRYGNEARQLWAGCPGTMQPSKIAKLIGLVDWPEAEEARRGGDR
ncbi:MAG TPA: SCO family protein [Pyrinomonadaceae bacterium]|nr:SCO family protein [Pyrinomonadaceae bacterium]